MTKPAPWLRWLLAASQAIWCVVAPGCSTLHVAQPSGVIAVQPNAPRELTKTILPPYRIEPPDVLQIDAINVVPKTPYHLRMLDSLVIQVGNALPDAPISGTFIVEPGGMVNLGYPYGRVKVSGLTVDEAKAAIEKQLKETLREPTVSVAIAEIVGKQQIAGQHLVAQDGTVSLGSYGSVVVVGQTLPEAKATLEKFLSKDLEEPELSVEVFGYNSKNYYVITQGAQLGDGVSKFPITGNETVLDAIAQINGLTSISSTKIWIARPGHNPQGCDQILPVDWIALTQRGDATTNYQLLPGDRVYVAEDKLVTLDNFLAKVISPMERIFGITLLGSSTVFNLKNGGQNGGNGGGP